MDRVGGREGRYWGRGHLIVLPHHLPGGEALPHVLKPLDEPLLLPVGAEMRVLAK